MKYICSHGSCMLKLFTAATLHLACLRETGSLSSEVKYLLISSVVNRVGFVLDGVVKVHKNYNLAGI